MEAAGPPVTHVDDDEAWRREVSFLAALHGQVLRESGWAETAAQLERLHSDPGLSVDIVDGLAVDDAENLARAVTVYLHLTNLSDERHRARLLQRGSAAQESDAGDALWPEVARAKEFTLGVLGGLRIHPVLTAHPTEARRQAVSTGLRRIAFQLDRYDDPRVGDDERWVAHRRLLEEVELLHRTSVLRTTRPGPLDEVRTVMTVFDQTLFRAVPRLYRATETSVVGDASGSVPTPVPAFVRFGSWVGGDRDGNPFVTAEVTRQTMATQADHALRALHASARRVGRTLTLDEGDTPASRELSESLALDAVSGLASFAELATSSPREPHRLKMLVIADRLEATRLGRVETSFRSPEALLDDLRMVQRSLVEASAHRSAHGELQHLIWAVETFGFHLAELEVRQHSSVHRRALIDLIGQLPESGDAETLVDDAAFLDRLAVDGWPAHVAPRDDGTREVLDTLRVMAWLQQRWGKRSCGRYVVSFSQSPAHLAAVRALARQAVGNAPLDLDVVPLFETGDDLAHATSTLDGWLQLRSTQEWLADRHRAVEVMLGYSDSAKDVGPASATLTLARTQRDLVAWADRHAITLTLFHGRGGSLGRGGGPLHRAITAQPPGSVAGRLKVTEQGEVVFARYADTTVAQRHLERLTTAVLLADTPAVTERNAAAAEQFTELGATVGDASRAAFRSLVETAGFADVFAAVSPLEELGDLRLGSRPVRRSGATAGRDLADLRAIPWVFAWAQTRVNLPGWYGLGSGLAAVGDIGALRVAYAQWPLFAAMIEVAEMSLAKSHRELAAKFLALAGRPDITDRILTEMDLTRSLVLETLEQREPLERARVLHASVGMRAPYVDTLSRLQLRALTHLRTADSQGAADVSQQEVWRRLLLLTVNGAAAGLQNTG